MTDNNPASNPDARRLGTFAGVFTPSILTILGLILFLRLGYVIGSAGLGLALVIILMANTISVLTSISLAAIATNLRVKGGGDYYVISRTLGVGFGAALGAVLFFAQAVSIAFYCLGFGEAFAALFESPPAWCPQAVAGAAVAVLLVPTLLGADWATRFQYVIMAALFAGIASFLVGGLAGFDLGQLESNWSISGGPPFWVVFAIFFPAVTGFTQGVSMSGDLADPGRSLPRGTFLAVGLSAAIYFLAAVVFAGALPAAELAGDTTSMRGVASVPLLVDLAALAATLSSALASFLGAPRILQSLASDRIFPFVDYFARGHGATNNPRRGVLLAAVIAASAVAIGRLDLIAPVVSMFFLISYGLLNYATYVEARANSPSFRPRFRYFHPWLSLLGAATCATCMVALNVTAGIVALVILFGIYYYVKHRTELERWADSSRSTHIERVRRSLLAVSEEPEHPRDWRPVMLVFSDDPERRQRILRFASWVEGNSGFTTVVQILEGAGALSRKQRLEAEARLRADIAAQPDSRAFPLAVLSPTVRSAIGVLVQSAGLGPIRSNTALLNWFDRGNGDAGERGSLRFLRNLRTMLHYGLNVVILEATEEELARLEATPADQRTIHVWYQDDASGRLMLLFAYLMTRHPEWRDASLHLLACQDDQGETAEEALGRLRTMLGEVRIEAEPELVVPADPEALMRRSAGASLVFCPFRVVRDGLVGPAGHPLEELIDGSPVTALVLAAQDISLDAEPEAGLMGQIAEAEDAVAQRKKIAAKAEKSRGALEAEVGAARAALAARREEGAGEEAIAEAERELAAAEEREEKARRRVARMQAKADDAAREMAELVEKSLGTAPAEATEQEAAPGDEPASA